MDCDEVIMKESQAPATVASVVLYSLLVVTDHDDDWCML